MGPLIRSLLAPLASLVLLILASGLFNTFVSVRLELEGYENEQIGLVTSALYFGILIGSLWVDRLIHLMGHSRSFILFALVSMGVILAQSLWIDPIFWMILRTIGGICMAGIFVAIESWLLIAASFETRGAILSVYLGVFYGALSIGQFLINLADPLGPFPFYIAAALCALSIIPLFLAKLRDPTIGESERLSLIQLFRLSPLGFLGGVISGMLLAAIYGLVPVFATEIGLSVSDIGTLMATLIFGGLALQWPMGYFADRFDRREVLVVGSALAALFALAIAFAFDHSFLLLLLLAWSFGGFSFTLYPLSMAYTCEKVADNQIVAATGGFVLSYGMGAIAGPILAPIAMNFFGSAGLFYYLALISLTITIAGLKKSAVETEPE